MQQILETDLKNIKDFEWMSKNYEKRIEELEDVRRTLGNRIRRARRKQGWDQKQLAEFLGYKSQKTIQRSEHGLVNPPAKVLNWLEGAEAQKETQGKMSI